MFHPWMLLAEVNYLCGVSPGDGERRFSRGLESQLHIKKLSARVPHPLTPRTLHNSVQNCPKDIWGRTRDRRVWPSARSEWHAAVTSVLEEEKTSKRTPGLVCWHVSSFTLIWEQAKRASFPLLCVSYWNHRVVIYKSSHLMFWPLLLVGKYLLKEKCG